VTGAIACLRGDGSIAGLENLPIMTYKSAKWIDGVEFFRLVHGLRHDESATAIVERTHAMPPPEEGKPQFGGRASAHSKGMTLGSTLAILQVAGCAIELVEPQVWKRAHGLLMPKASYQEKKWASLERARKLFPRASLERLRDTGLAEALLIASYKQQSAQQGELHVA
jgi:hypothetical protein